MPVVFIPAPMRDLTDGVVQVTLPDGGSLRGVIAALDGQFPGLKSRLQQGDALAFGLAVSIDGNITARGLLAQVKPDSEVHFLPAIGGG